jgi:anti-sigma regulatory factor (Ser/Thr protein kinase)
LLYTDGLVERRREPLDVGIGRAADVVANNGAATLDDLAELIMTGTVPDGGYHDDVAMLLYRQPAPLQVAILAEPTRLAPTRAALRAWLTLAGVSSDQALNVLVATGEALANAVEHGHRHHPDGVIRLHAMTLGDSLLVTVADAGSWKTPQPTANPHRGRGITLMRALMHDVSISPGVAGTKVEMQMRIA